jgi:hypothetical protein
MKVFVIFFCCLFTLLLFPNSINWQKPELVIKATENNDFYKINDVIFSATGDCIYVLDSGNGRIIKFDRKGNLLKFIGTLGQGPENFYNPKSLTLVKDKVWIADFKNNKIKIMYNDKIIKAKQLKEISFPVFIIPLKDKVAVSSISLKSEKNNSIAFYDFDCNIVKTISPGIKIKNDVLVNDLYNGAYLTQINDYSFAIAFYFTPIVKIIDHNGKLLHEYSLDKYITSFYNKSNGFPVYFSIKSIASAHKNTFWVVKCDYNDEFKQCGEIIRFNHDFTEIIERHLLNKDIRRIKYFKKQQMLAIITLEDELIFYKVSTEAVANE